MRALEALRKPVSVFLFYVRAGEKWVLTYPN